MYIRTPGNRSIITSMVNDNGGKLKETGTTHWNSPNTGATNVTHFTGLPGGTCYKGEFILLGNAGFWWSTTITNNVNNNSMYMHLRYNEWVASRSEMSLNNGFSIRCIRN
jgi:uncharacterized protein (TIGR02145 family)